MTASQARYRARQALRSARQLRREERRLAAGALYEEALEVHRLVLEGTCSFRYWRGRERSGL